MAVLVNRFRQMSLGFQVDLSAFPPGHDLCALLTVRFSACGCIVTRGSHGAAGADLLHEFSSSFSIPY